MENSKIDFVNPSIALVMAKGQVFAVHSLQILWLQHTFKHPLYISKSFVIIKNSKNEKLYNLYINLKKLFFSAQFNLTENKNNNKIKKQRGYLYIQTKTKKTKNFIQNNKN